MWTMSVAGIVQMLCAMPVWLATSKNCVSEAGDSRRIAASPADIVDWASSRSQVSMLRRLASSPGPIDVSGMESSVEIRVAAAFETSW